MIIVKATFPASPDHRETVAGALVRFAGSTRKEDGCVSCLVTAMVEGNGELLVLQQWRDMDALREHYTSDHLAELLTMLCELQVGEIDTERFEVRNIEDDHDDVADAPRVLH